MKIIVINKKASFDYEIIETIETGIVLTGDEVKSLRQVGVSLAGAFITIHGSELYLINCSIKPYTRAFLKDESSSDRRRKLLVHKKELSRLIGISAQKGISMLPLKMYFSDSQKVKVLLGIGRHKKFTDKKEAIKERDIARENRALLKYR